MRRDGTKLELVYARFGVRHDTACRVWKKRCSMFGHSNRTCLGLSEMELHMPYGQSPEGHGLSTIVVLVRDATDLCNQLEVYTV